MPDTNATYGGATFDRTRRFGVEIECFVRMAPESVAAALTAAGVPCQAEAYNHQTRDAWKIVSDASLRPTGGRGWAGYYAMEIVSPPLAGEEGLTQIRRVCAVINTLGAKINQTCGLHVHHDAVDLTPADLRAVLTTYWKWEEVIKFFLPTSRRANNYARMASAGAYSGYRATGNPLTDAESWGRLVSRIESKADAMSAQPGRYAAVNLHSLDRHNTVEFRQHGGTTDYSKIEAWVVLTQWFVTRAVAKGCRVTTPCTGRWAAESRFFWRSIDWVNVTDAVILRAKAILSVRFKKFRTEAAAGVVEVAEAGE